MTQQPLDLIIEFPEGAGELIVDPTHPAVAGFRRGLIEGQRTGAWRYLIVHDQPRLLPIIIGTFVKTPKSRVLFFPGADIAIQTDDPTARFNGKQLDHITADPPKKPILASHIAARELPHDKSRGLNYRSKPPPEHMWPWFSLLIPDLSGFVQLPARLIVRFLPPPGDLEMFFNRLIGDGGSSEVFPLPSASGSGISYFQFDVWLGRGFGWQSRQVKPLAWSYKSEIVQDPPSEKQQLQIGHINFSFDSQLGIVVLVSRPQGILQDRHILRPTLSQ